MPQKPIDNWLPFLKPPEDTSSHAGGSVWVFQKSVFFVWNSPSEAGESSDTEVKTIPIYNLIPRQNKSVLWFIFFNLQMWSVIKVIVKMEINVLKFWSKHATYFPNPYNWALPVSTWRLLTAAWMLCSKVAKTITMLNFGRNWLFRCIDHVTSIKYPLCVFSFILIYKLHLHYRSVPVLAKCHKKHSSAVDRQTECLGLKTVHMIIDHFI